MKLKCTYLVIKTLLAALLICNVYGVIRSEDRELLSRVKRQLNIHQGAPVQNAVVNIPVPINNKRFTGVDQKIDKCPRNQVVVGYGYKCERLLSRGSCKIDEEVILNPDNNMGFCAPRLCPPDRIFVHATQLCHDPQDTSVCPASRELFSTAYGTAICDCPVGTVEISNDTPRPAQVYSSRDNSRLSYQRAKRGYRQFQSYPSSQSTTNSYKLHGDVCEPILSKSNLCQNGQVIWFKDFDSPAQCLPDPCHGKNLQRLPSSLPFVPSKKNGKCHQLGQTSGVCQPGLIYALHLPTLRGVCETLENLGYDIFNQEDLDFLNRMYGITEVKNDAIADTIKHNEIFGMGSVLSKHQGQSFSYGHSRQPSDQSHFQPSQSYFREQSLNPNHISADFRSEVLQGFEFLKSAIPGVLLSFVSNGPSDGAAVHDHPYSRKIRSLDATDEDNTKDFSSFPEENANVTATDQSIARDKRQGQQSGKLLHPHNNAANIFDIRLMQCSPGSKRDINVKCQETVLPGSLPKSRRSVTRAPIPPTHPCPTGEVRNLQRMCTSQGSAQNARNAIKLG